MRQADQVSGPTRSKYTTQRLVDSITIDSYHGRPYSGAEHC
ncbi:hypothetical protein [Corynebacterium sp. 20_84]